MSIVVNLRFKKNGPKMRDVLRVLRSKGKNKSDFIDRIASYYSKDPI